MTDIFELLDEYVKGAKTFANRYKIHQHNYHKRDESRLYIDIIDSLLSSYYEIYGVNKFAQIFYVIKNGISDNKCRYCGNPSSLFLSFEKGYSKYCSSKCSRKDGSKTSQEMIDRATSKRSEKMRILLDDPIEGNEYRRKLSVKSSYYNNLPENKEKKSIEMKKKILAGEWTPNITNSWTRWGVNVGEKSFRSSFEAIFYIHKHLFQKNIFLEYEKLRIKYFFENKESIYIVDFIDTIAKEVFEIKPKCLAEGARNIAKRNTLVEWCQINDYKYIEISERNLVEYVNQMQSECFDHQFVDIFKTKYKKLFY